MGTERNRFSRIIACPCEEHNKVTGPQKGPFSLSLSVEFALEVLAHS